jgi:hypothetical protein
MTRIVSERWGIEEIILSNKLISQSASKYKKYVIKGIKSKMCENTETTH